MRRRDLIMTPSCRQQVDSGHCYHARVICWGRNSTASCLDRQASARNDVTTRLHRSTTRNTPLSNIHLPQARAHWLRTRSPESSEPPTGEPLNSHPATPDSEAVSKHSSSWVSCSGLGRVRLCGARSASARAGAPRPPPRKASPVLPVPLPGRPAPAASPCLSGRRHSPRVRHRYGEPAQKPAGAAPARTRRAARAPFQLPKEATP